MSSVRRPAALAAADAHPSASEVHASTPAPAHSPVHLPVRSGAHWHSTTFRFFLAYVAIFSLSVLALLGLVGTRLTGFIEHQTDFLLVWQVRYFAAIPPRDLSFAIQQRLGLERVRANYYGLFDASGARLAGDIVQMPPQLPLNGQHVTLRGTLAVTSLSDPPLVRALANRLPDGRVLVIARNISESLAIRDAIINGLGAGGVLALAAGIVGGLLLSIWQLRRIRAMQRVIQRIVHGDLNQRLPVRGRDEIDMLAQLVNHMLDEIERLMTEVKGVCDGIAHDLRTPLTHVRTLLMHAAERADSSGDAQLDGLLTQARRETDALLNRFRAMLRISEIEALRRRGGMAELQMAILVNEIGQMYQPLAEDKQIALLLEIEPDVPLVQGDRALLFEALSNLLGNAIKFTPPGGHITVRLAATAAGPRIEVIDDGPGIPAAEREAVRQRFYRGEGGRHLPGSGLGLSIVSAVAHVHDFTLRIGDAAPGTHVTLECWPQTLA